MEWNDSPTIVGKFKAAARDFDRQAAVDVCDELIARLKTTDEPFPAVDAKSCLSTLRSQRFFGLMQRLAEAFIMAGHEATHQIQRQYAQALLDQEHIVAAVPILERLVAASAANPGENAEARGLLGRSYKQLYVDAGTSTTERSRRNLADAIRWYADVYTQDPSQLWHGINAVALLERARRDGVEVPGSSDPRPIASAILEKVGNLDEPASWDFATAAEACVALDRAEDALRWTQRYVLAAAGDAFAISSTHRQLVEVWRLGMGDPTGQLVLPLLRAALLRSTGGELAIEQGDLTTGTIGAVSRTEHRYEALLGDTNTVSLPWYKLGLERCRAVARIEDMDGVDGDRGFGTGFLLHGKDLCDTLAGRCFVLTNAHVVSTADARALRPDRARISFKALSDQQPVDRTAKQLAWSSPPDQLDASLLEIDPLPIDTQPYALASGVPLEDEGARVYIIGHPGGGGMSFSINDNRLLDHDARLVHYRAPTQGGSSGSPVFNQKWQLVALHHAGGTDVPRLNGKPGRYAANEGIWIGAIREAVRSNLPSQG